MSRRWRGAPEICFPHSAKRLVEHRRVGLELRVHGAEAGRLQHERALAVGKDTIGEPGVLRQRRARI